MDGSLPGLPGAAVGSGACDVREQGDRPAQYASDAALLIDTDRCPVRAQVQRPQVQPVIIQDLFIFRSIARLANSFARRRLGTNAELIVDEFAEKLLEELDYNQEARNIEVRPLYPIWCLPCACVPGSAMGPPPGAPHAAGSVGSWCARLSRTLAAMQPSPA